MSENNNWENGKKKTIKGLEGVSKGSKVFNSMTNYKIVVNAVSNKVSVIQKATKEAVIRLDHAHKGCQFEHININPKISGIKDPHIPLPPGSLAVGSGAARVVKAFNKVALPLAIAIDTAKVGCSAYKDSKNGTTRNTVETAASVAGGWTGGFGGATAGIAIGTAIFPGVGTIIGGIVGGVIGGIGGSVGAEKAASAIADSCNYDIEEYVCKNCSIKFKVRKYQGDKNVELCSICLSNLSDHTLNIHV